MRAFNYILKFALVGWICFFSLFDSHTISGLVLCLGPDGHIAIEGALHEESADAETSACHSQAAAYLETGDADCGKCLDISLTQSCASPALASKTLPAPPAPVAILRLPLSDFIATASQHRFPVLADPPRTPALARSVVLLV